MNRQDLEKMEESERQEAEIEKVTRLEIRKLDGQIASIVSAIHDIEASILEKLSVQTATEKNSQVIVQETKQLRNKVRTLIQNSVQLQNEYARTRVDILNTEAEITRYTNPNYLCWCQQVLPYYNVLTVVVVKWIMREHFPGCATFSAC